MIGWGDKPALARSQKALKVGSIELSSASAVDLLQTAKSAIGSGKGLRLGLEAALTILLAYLAASLVWAMLAPSSMLGPKRSASQPFAAAAPQAMDRSLLTSFDPFNRETRAAAAAPARAAPRTTLALKLYGVRTTDGTHKTAIIGRTDGSQVLVAVGEEIEPGVRLTEVQPDRVIISRLGVKESLEFPKPRNGSAITTTSRSAASTSSGQNTARTYVVENFGNFTEAVVVQPIFEHGRFLGVRLEPRQPGFLETYGFQPGDVVTRIEDTPLHPGVDLSGLLEDLENLSRIRIFVERQGQEIQLNLDFQS